MNAQPLLAGIALLLGQAGTPAPQAPVHENRAPVQASPAAARQPSREVDRIFALAAIQGNDAELDMAQLALRRGGANEVKSYAGKMIAEHGGMMEEMLPALRRVLGGSPPQRLAPPDALAYRRLQNLAPADFDQAYAMQQIGDHLATLAAFQTEAEDGADPQLVALVRKWTPTIQAHLELAVDLTRHIGGSSPFKQH